MKKNPWTVTKHRWKLKSGEILDPSEPMSNKITPEDVKEMEVLPEEDKKKLKMQYYLDKQDEENENAPKQYRRYTI